MEKKVVPTLVNFKKFEIGAILVSLFGNERKTRIAAVFLGLLLLGASSLFAEESLKKGTALKEIGYIEGRGFVNLTTCLSEFVFAFKSEKKQHPKAWPLTYGPRVFANVVTRFGSTVHDNFILPWYVMQAKDDTPLTRRFGLPDYAWQKE